MFELDHLAVVAATLDEGCAHVERTLGVSLQPGGQHAHFGTHNMLLGLEDGLYLEVIAIDPGAPKLTYPRWFDLDRFTGAPRIGNWICRVSDLDRAVAGHPAAGDPVALARGDLRWRMAVPQDGVLPLGGIFPALMQWDGDDHPAARLTPSGCRLSRLRVVHPKIRQLRSMMAGEFDDSRIVFEEGPAGLHAEFDTPSGPRVL